MCCKQDSYRVVVGTYLKYPLQYKRDGSLDILLGH